ncbi:MAG: hypothetical protein EXR65_05030, partial [Dehalococcoidia bacterium]|nr:hypothetical protein [Dehalococcoidia bacterium]
ARRHSFRVAEVDARHSRLPFYTVDQLTRQLGVRTDGDLDGLARLHALRLACQRASAGRAGVAIVVDNAELLAAEDIEALHDLAGAPPVEAFFALFTVGPRPSQPSGVTDLAGTFGLHRSRHEWLTLDPLTDEEVSRLVEEHLGPGITTYRFVRELRELGAGIAGHVVAVLETVAALAPQARVQVMTGSEFLAEAFARGGPPGALAAPFAALAPEALLVARALATLGEPSHAGAIAAMLRRPPGEIEGVLAMLEDRGLTRTTTTASGEVLSDFAIPLGGVTVRCAIPTLLRRQLHDAAALLQERSGRADADQALTFHYLEGSLPFTAGRVERVLAVAQQLVKRSRYAAARRLLEGLIRRGPADRVDTLPARAFTVLSEALSRSGAAGEARRALDTAVLADQAPGGGVEAIVRQARNAIAQGREQAATDILEGALPREDLDRGARLRVMLELSRLLIHRDDLARGRQMAEMACELARDLPDWRLTAEADIALHSSYLYAGQAQYALAHCRRALISAHRAGHGDAIRARALSGVGHALLDAGTIDRGLRWIRRAHRAAEIAEDLATASWTSQMLAEGCIEHGAWDEAAQWAERAVRLDASLHRDRSLEQSRALEARLRGLRGIVDPAWAGGHDLPPPPDTLDGPTASAAVTMAHVEHALAAGNPRQAAALAGAAAARLRERATGQRALIVNVLPAVVASARALGDLAAAQAATDELGALAARLGEQLRVATPLHLFARAQVAAMAGDWERSAAGALEAGTGFEALGYHWRAANAFELAGEACVRAYDPRAEEHLIRAFRCYRSVGAQTRLAATRGLLHAIGSRAPRHREPASILTTRQWEIARHAASGQTDAAIAATLSISRRTVTTHMHNALGRLGLESRHQLAVWFRDHPQLEA